MPLFLISLKACGTGLNLTAADYVIHLDPMDGILLLKIRLLTVLTESDRSVL